MHCMHDSVFTRRNPVVPKRTVRVDGYPVKTTVTARPAVVRRWVYTTLWLNRRRLYTSGGGLTVGLGVQWTPTFRKLPAGAEPRPGTLQLCVGNRCLVLQLARVGGCGAVPHILRRYLGDARVTFAAYNVGSDLRKLRAHHGLEVASTLELHGAAGMGNASMADMAERLLGVRRHGLLKSRKVGASRWDGPKLSRDQVRYAAVDAYLSCRLGSYLRRRRRRAAAAAAYVAVAYQDDDESEAEYYSDDDDDDDVRSTASDEGSDQEYQLQQCGWGRRCGGQQQDWEEEEDDDHVYDSMCSVVY